jgi:hypothetical protein
MHPADRKVSALPGSAARYVAIRLTEDMFEAIVAELDRRMVSRELREAFRRARSLDVQRPWPEREYVVGCARPISTELVGHLEKALRRTGGVRRGALSRALLRITDGERAAGDTRSSGSR